MLECGSFNQKNKKKKRVSSVTCHLPKLSTRQSDHTSPCAPGAEHGEAASLAVCLLSGHTAKPRALPCACCPGTRQSLELHRVSTARAHGEKPPTPSPARDAVCSLCFAVCLY